MKKLFFVVAALQYTVHSAQMSYRNSNSEAEEYSKLIAQNSGSHKEKTVKLLNQLFDNDAANKDAILLIENKSDCNMIVRIRGKEACNLAVPARGENSLVLKKGDYQLTGNACATQYSSVKSIAKNMLVTLNKPVVAQSPVKFAQNKTIVP